MVIDREPEGIGNIIDNSHILEASHVRECFRWTGENSFFIKGDLDCFAVGGGSGHFGLWVDENLYLGRSSPCYTFNNCCLSETDDFRIMELEVWTFS
ncbi:hypothetical protein GOODEAATRI_017614 [Goodea atripinnis]|uniref:TLDc domain-containing protein n=1 Tax=Goodea atripinnis TaxID=208336 RepID=A0ABV0PF45_9TELE